MSFFHRHPWLTPYVLLAPGLALLLLFFVVPLGYLGYQSLQVQDPIEFTYTFEWAWGNYKDALTQYDAHLVRSFLYAGIATVLALLISYPLAYWIAFRGGRWKNLLLLFIIGPFFVTYLIRTLAWQTILADDGWVLDVLQSIGIVSDGGRLLDTSVAVVAGITYNFLPFMALPLYVALEQVDRRWLEAANDLYANKVQAFLRVTLPVTMPGVVAGTLLTFIPAAGDFVNAELLGTERTTMIGNVVQQQFVDLADYPVAASISLLFMGVILIALFVYAKAVGTERLTG